MKKVISIFLAQFAYIMLLGLQQLNVAHSAYVGAASVSFMLGVLGFSLMATIAEVRSQARFTPIWWGYVLAGPIGICTAIASHDFLTGLYKAIF